MTLATATNTLDLATLRHRLGLTQQELAVMLKVTTRTIRKWEQGGPMHLIWQDRLANMFRAKFPSGTVPRLVRK